MYIFFCLFFRFLLIIQTIIRQESQNKGRSKGCHGSCQRKGGDHMAKNYEELKLSDDFMFGKVMEDGVLCQEVLECLLGKPVGELTEIQPQCEYR